MENVSSFTTVPAGKVFIQYHDMYWGGEHPHNNFRYGFLEYVNHHGVRVYNMNEMKTIGEVRVVTTGTFKLSDGNSHEARELPKDGCFLDEGELILLESVHCHRISWQMKTIISDPFVVQNRNGRICQGIPSLGRWIAEEMGKW